MTAQQKQTPPDRQGPAAALLPFDPLELTHVRCRPADLARMLEVTRQSVSQWIKVGKITLGADGLLDPKVAVRQLLRNTDIARVRAQVLKPLTRDADALRQQIAELQRELARAREDRDFNAQAVGELHEVAEIFRGLVKAHLDDLAMAVDLDGVLMRLWDLAFKVQQDRADELAEPGADELAWLDDAMVAFDRDLDAASNEMGGDLLDGIAAPAEGELEALLREMDEEYGDIPRAPGDAVEGAG